MVKRSHISSRTWRLWTGAALALVFAREADAGAFSVNPTQIFLSPGASTQLLTLRNESDDTLRFQLTAFKWQQAADGAMQLEPTNDVIFFPAMLSLGAKDERRIRIGVTVPFDAIEKTYRLFVQELPPEETGEGPPPGGIRMLTKLGIPVFLRPPKPAAQATLRDLVMTGGAFSFSLYNGGNVHFLPETVVVRGFDASGARVFEQEVTSWYVLANTPRAFTYAVPTEACGKLRSLEVEARIAKTSLKERLQTPAPVCKT